MGTHLEVCFWFFVFILFLFLIQLFEVGRLSVVDTVWWQIDKRRSEGKIFLASVRLPSHLSAVQLPCCDFISSPAVAATSPESFTTNNSASLGF